MVHGVSGSLLQAQGDWRDAEAEYLAAAKAWEEAGPGDTADAASEFAVLGDLSTEETASPTRGERWRSFVPLN